MRKKIITQIGFESNGVIAFYRKPKNISTNENPIFDWTQMQAIKVRKYWYEIAYKRFPEIVGNINRNIIFYDELEY